MNLISLIAIIFACPDEKLCRECQDGKCKTCHLSFILDKTCQVPETADKLDHCLAYKGKNSAKDPTLCDLCEWGYGSLTKKGEKGCFKCDTPHCAACEDNICVGCFDGLVATKNTEGVVTCEKPKVPIDNCKVTILIDGDSCFECVNGFVLS